MVSSLLLDPLHAALLIIKHSFQVGRARTLAVAFISLLQVEF